MAQDPDIQNVYIKSGILTACGLIGYFLLMRLFGLHDVFELRFLNILILFAGIRYSLSFVRKNTQAVSYMQGLGAGMFTTIIATGIFVVFMGVYLMVIDPEFIELIKQGDFFGSYLTPASVLGVIMLEGAASGGILSFVMMQYYKRFIPKNM